MAGVDEEPVPLNRAVVGWCLYDLANTIFAINMTSYHFPVWIVADRGATELMVGLAFSGSILASALLMPWLGRRADRSGKKMPALIGWTLACVLFTGSISGVKSIFLGLTLFALANFCYQLAGVFYNALLPMVTSVNWAGRISGYGVALGYVGTLVGIFSTAPVVARWGRQASFLATGLLFLLFSLPCFLWVREPKREDQKPASTPLAYRPATVDSRLLSRLLWACFWGLNAVSTVILFMSIYAKQAIGFTDAQLHRFLITSTLAAIVGAAGWGWLTDRIGSYRSLGWVWAAWAVVLGGASLSLRPTLFWILGSLAGVALGGTWVASRILILDLVGSERVGEAFGKFGMVSRLAAVGGPLVWGLILWLGKPWGDLRYRVGMGTLLSFVLLGGWLYHRLGAGPDTAFRRSRDETGF